MKKLIATVLLFCLLAINVSAASPSVIVDIPNQTSTSDGQYSVTVSIKDNPGFASLQMKLYYDPNVMSCKTIISGEAVPNMLSSYNLSAIIDNKTCAIFVVAGINNTTANGDIATFVFSPLNNGTPNFDFQLVEVRDVSGSKIDCTVTINDNYGDASGDTIETVPPETKPVETEPVVTNPVETESEETRPSYPYPPEEETEDERTDEPVEPDLPVVEPEEEIDLTFTDLAKDHWAYRYIGKAVPLGIIKGYPDGSFASEREMTRAEFATLLWNLEGQPIPQQTAPFNDVKTSDWFCAAVSWAYENGYINGVSDRAFAPNGKITREQAMTILYRYASCPETSYTLAKFADRGEISSYAVDAMSWAVDKGIISGIDSTHVAPKAYATRAQLATIIVRYLAK